MYQKERRFKNLPNLLPYENTSFFLFCVFFFNPNPSPNPKYKFYVSMPVQPIINQAGLHCVSFSHSFYVSEFSPSVHSTRGKHSRGPDWIEVGYVVNYALK